MTPPPDFLLVHLLTLIPPRPGSLALDAGSGRGRNSSYLSQLGYRVLPLDRVRRRGLIQGDVRGLPLADEAFDLVLCDSVFDTWTRADPRCGVSELRRVLKPGGHLLLVAAAAEGSDSGSLAFTREAVLGWIQGLELLELLYVRVDYPPVAGVRAQWALAARRP